MLDETPLDDAATATHATPHGSRTTLAIVGLAVPLFAIALYAAIGNRGGLAPQPAPAAQAEVSPEAVNAMLEKLSQRLEKSSGNAATDLQGWTMLARSYAALQRFAEADRAYARAITLAPNDAELLADRADVLAVLQGQRTDGEPDRLIARALQIDPRNLKALALAGAGAFERKDFAAARGYWQQARALVPDGTEFAAGLDRSLREMPGGANDGSAAVSAPRAPSATPAATVAAAPSAGGVSPTSAASAARITGRVSLAPALAAKAAPTDTVFVFARAAEGPRMPLAILRRTVAELPFTFTLDDTQAMSPQTRLSSAARVIVGARVSRSGQALPQPGDLRGESGAIGNRSDGLQLVIDTVQP